jgi:hypothetical protein
MADGLAVQLPFIAVPVLMAVLARIDRLRVPR